MRLTQSKSLAKALLFGLLISIASTAALPKAASAQDFLSDAQHMFFDASMLTRRFGIEIEFSNVSDEVVEQIIVEKLSAKVAERLPSGEVLFTTPYGEVRLKIEGQAWRYENDPARYTRQVAEDKLHAPREIVFPPMTYKDVQPIQDVGLALRDHGAIGTTDTQAVSTQVNVEMPLLIKDGVENPAAVENFLNLMRVYSDKEHAQQIEDKIHVPAIRREYIKDYSPGFLKRIENKTYKPTARQLFDDYFYRQSLEILNIKGAWTMSLDDAKKIL
ncbi:MAG: amidoligase family protein, partial [Deltaproteobacteria bacterium]|nr:amidoligase family protein [Deltaproteobacteria bacterium]